MTSTHPLTNGNAPSGAAHIEYTVEVPVLIIGGGPTGLLSAYMLSKLGGSLPPIRRPTKEAC